MNHVSLRFGTHHRYAQSTPLCGRTGRFHDYPSWSRLCFRVGAEVSSFLRHNPRWRRSSQVYSHSVITWSKQALQITVFFLNYSRRRRRIYRNCYRRRYLVGYIGRTLLVSLFSLVRAPSTAARQLNYRCGGGFGTKRFDSRYKSADTHRKRRDLPRRRRRRQKRRLFSYPRRRFWRRRSRQRVKNPSHLTTWVKALRFRRFGFSSPEHTTNSNFTKTSGSNHSRQRWLLLAWRISRRRHLRRASAVALWSSQKASCYSVPLRWRWKRLPRVGSVNTVLAVGAYRLRGRFTRRINLMARPLLRLAQRVPGMRSVYLRCAGRFTRQERADCKTYRVGKSLGRSDFGQPLQSGRWVVPLKFGTVSLTMTMSLLRHASPRRSR